MAEKPKEEWLFEQGWWAHCIRQHSGEIRRKCVLLFCKAYPATRTATRPASGHRNHTGAFGGYEAVKSSLTAKAISPTEYASACRKAAKKARV